jgi:hypothetical protein
MKGDVKSALQRLVDDLRQVFGSRLEAVLAYGWRPAGRIPNLALVSSLSFDDLTVCATHSAAWHRSGCGTPLLMTPREFARSLDAFPIEYGEILATAEVVYGSHPFAELAIAREDMRRACEVQVKSHLLHLREDYVECGGRPRDVASLVRDSAPAFVALLRHLARLDDVTPQTDAELIAHSERRAGLEPRLVGDLVALASTDPAGSVDAGRLFPAYLHSVEQLAEFVDLWRK